MQKLIYSLVFSLLLSFSLVGQSNYMFELLTKEEKANFGSVHNLYQDSSGVIWMGIFGKGLSYYNGKSIKRMELADEDDFSLNYNVFEEANGLLFLNCKNQIKVFDPIQQVVIDSIVLADSMSDKIISDFAVVQDAKNRIVWALLIDKGTVPGKSRTTPYGVVVAKNSSFFSHNIDDRFLALGGLIAEVFEGDLLVKSENDFLLLDSDVNPIWSIDMSGFDLKNVKTKDIQIYKKHTVFLNRYRRDSITRQFEGELIRIQKGDEEPKTVSYRRNIEGIDIRQLHKEWNYTIHFDIVGDGAFISAAHQYINFEDYSTKQLSIVNNMGREYNLQEVLGVGGINTYLEDASGVIWVGGLYGIGKLVPQPSAFLHLEALGMRNLIEGEDGKIYGSLNWTLKEEKREVSALGIWNPESSTMERKPGFLWMGAIKYNGFIHARGRKIEISTLDSEESFIKGLTDLLLLDRKERAWATNWYESKVHVYDMNKEVLVKEYNIPQLELNPVEINDWYQRASDGSIWMGTYGQGIFIFDEDGSAPRQLTSKSSSPIRLRNNTVSGFYEDKDGNMWIGHSEGLSVLESGKSEMEHISIDKNNPSGRLVYSILPEDNDRYLWLSTSKGIFRFDRKERTTFDFPLNPYVKNQEYNRLSYLKTSSGRFIYGSSRINNPSIAFYPKEVVKEYSEMQPFSSSIVLDKITKYDITQKVETTLERGLQGINSLTLNPEDRYFELEFISTDLRMPDNNHYSFYLEGYEDGWNRIRKGNNKVRYENLESGTYTLKMKGGLSPQLLNSDYRSLKIIVLPHWYNTWWARVLFLAIGIIGLFFLFNYRLKRKFDKKEIKRVQEVNALKTRLYTNITHEFRTPLTVILGMNDNIQGHSKEKELIKRNARNLLRLISQILDFSKLDSGSLTLDQTDGDLNVYLKYLTESFYSMASDKKINLEFVAGKGNLFMKYDEIKIQHIIYNLLSNAIKFTNPGGKIVLSVERKLNHNNGDWVAIKVKDSGVGMEKRELDKIFTRFYQVDNPEINLKTYEGTGIGLALTKELVEMMSGKISVESELGWGTEFIILLPYLSSSEENKEEETPLLISSNQFVQKFDQIAPKPDQIQGDKPIILLVEDNDGVVEYVRSILSSDYNLIVGINGQEGEELAIEHIPDLIITDVMMPLKDGHELTEILKKDIRTSHIPIIILTAKADLDSKIDGLKRGVDVYLTKPFEKNELFAQIENLLLLRNSLQKYYLTDEEASEPRNELQSEEDIFINKLRNFIESNLRNSELSVEELSKEFNMSKSQLYRKIKALTDYPPSRFIRRVRLNRAKKLLLDKGMNISEIAYTTGFTDPNYFSRAFKKEFGVPPRSFE